MQVTEVIVSAGRTFNHPYENYSNLKPQVTFKATLSEGEDVAAVTKELQAQAEGMVEDHKQNMLKSINQLYQLTQAKAEVEGLERQIRSAQHVLETLREDNPQLALTV
jgi:ABC-type transporter Mla subunit MlaD